MVERKYTQGGIDKKLQNKMAIVSVCTFDSCIPDFFVYCLNKIKVIYDEIWIISSNKLPSDKLETYVNRIYESVKGDDFLHWKFAVEKLEQDQFLCVSDITFLNDTFYGPIFDFTDVWDYMEKKNVDFWGITRHQKWTQSDSYIQTYFINFKASLIKDNLSFFKNELTKYDCPEYHVSAYFESKGYTSSVYVNTTNWENTNPKLAESFLLQYPSHMVKDKKCPVISRYLFSLDEKHKQLYGNGDEIAKLLEYIKDLYPVEYIYTDQIYQRNIYDLVHSLDLNYIITGTSKNSLYRCRTAIFVYLYYENQFDYYMNRISNVPSDFDIYIFTTDDNKIKSIKDLAESFKLNVLVQKVDSRGREWACLLNEIKNIASDYSCACFLHDKSYHENEFPTQAYAFRDILWDNLLPDSSEKIMEIVNIFNENHHVGVLVPPIVKHGSYLKYYINFWMGNYIKTDQLLRELGISTDFIDEQITPISIGGMFWFRPNALVKLFSHKFNRDGFPEEPMPTDGTISHALERSIPYIAQSVGYYTAVIMTVDYLKHDWLVQSEMLRIFANTIENEFNYLLDL